MCKIVLIIYKLTFIMNLKQKLTIFLFVLFGASTLNAQIKNPFKDS